MIIHAHVIKIYAILFPSDKMYSMPFTIMLRVLILTHLCYNRLNKIMEPISYTNYDKLRTMSLSKMRRYDNVIHVTILSGKNVIPSLYR